jgi:hypothetical protein
MNPRINEKFLVAHNMIIEKTHKCSLLRICFELIGAYTLTRYSA